MGCDFTSANLHGVVFDGVACLHNDFTRADFSGATVLDLQTEFGGSIFVESKFDGNELAFVGRPGSSVITDLADPQYIKAKRGIYYSTQC